MTTVGKLLDLSTTEYISPFQFTDSLMISFTIQTEEVIKNEIDKFKNNGLEQDVIEICPDEGIYQHIDSYYGLSELEALNSDKFIDDIFLEFYPSLNKRSAFQTIYREPRKTSSEK